MHRTQQQVRAWHQAMGDDFPAPGAAPVDVTRNARLRLQLLAEELGELANALAIPLLLNTNPVSRQIIVDLGYLPNPIDEDPIETIDALADIQFVLSGAADTWSIDLEPYFDEVVRSNNTKVGGPIREDGKRLKPDTYEPPVLRLHAGFSQVSPA